MAASLSLCSSLTPKLSHSQTSIPFSHSRINVSFLSDSLSSLTLTPRKQPALSVTAKSIDTKDAVGASKPESEVPGPESKPAVKPAEPKREEVVAVVQIGSKQYMTFPGRFIYIEKLKGANVNDKVILNKVLMVGTKRNLYLGRPIVANARVEAIVEEQTLAKKVIVFKYKKKKNYKRNIGHRQPITRIRIRSITGYEDSPALPVPQTLPQNMR